MKLVCLDMEGVILPEIWIEFAEEAGIPELKRTTRDEPDYDKLMKFRLDLLRERGMGMAQIQEAIGNIEPLPGAVDFLDELRSIAQVVIISDTFTQFLEPLLPKLHYPTVFCNELVIDEDGMIEDYHLRCNPTKSTTVKALQSCGFETIASGDSYNDVAMIQISEAGFLFRTTDVIKAEYPDIPAYEEYEDLMAAIKAAL